jgi:hypothetical protein
MPMDNTFRRGSTLLLSLLILSTVLIITIALARLAQIEILLTRSNNNNVVATYAAESGLEQGAYRLRNSDDGILDLNVSVPRILSNQASWTRTTDVNSSSLVLRNFPKNLTKGFDFFNNDPGFGGSAAMESIKITVDECDGSEWFELGYVPLNPPTFFFGSFQKFRYHCSAGQGVTIINNALQSTQAYRLYIRYIQGNPATVSRLSIVGCTVDNGMGTCMMPGRAAIYTTGKYRSATRDMGFDMPRRSPMTGVFDYAIFSECQIIKDPTIPNPGC